MPPKGKKPPRKGKPPKKRRPLTGAAQVKESNKKLLDHFIQSQQNLEKRIKISFDRLFQNQQSQNQGLLQAEDHVLVLRRVLNDAMCGVTRVMTIERPSWDKDAEVGDVEEVQVIDWGWYGTQLTSCKGVANLLIAYRNMEARKAAEAEEAARKKRAKDAFVRVSHAVGKSPLEVLDVDDIDEVEDIEAAKEKLLAETKEYAELAGETIRFIEAGNETAAAEGMRKLEELLKAKEAEGLTPPEDGLPDGAAVFGGT